jgi:alpha-mannosidase
MERIKRLIRDLSTHQWQEQLPLTDWSVEKTIYGLPGQYVAQGELESGTDYAKFPGIMGVTFFFRRELEIPEAWTGGRIGLSFQSIGEGLLRVNGRSQHGVDRNHDYVTLDTAKLGRNLKLEIELFDAVPEPVDTLNYQATQHPVITSIASSLVLVNEAAQSLLYTVTVLRDSAQMLAASDLRRVRLIEALHETMDAFYADPSRVDHDAAWTKSLEAELVRKAEAQGGNAPGVMHMVGQSHIDVAWLWPVRETVRKTSRTFSTVDALMEEYPDFRYAQSQPQLYAFLKENDPELYGRIKQRVAEGKWELVGGMWVEPDLNIPGGESLMRQMLYGQRFYQEEFGLKSTIEWLPDTFGYCASLPQILKHGGIEYFMTSKLNWNDTNHFPYDLFHWVGIDGTAILSFLNHGLNEHTKPKDIAEHWDSFRQKNSHSEQMLLYGHGDGGGGVTTEMLAFMDRAHLMTGQPAPKHSTAGEFFREASLSQDKLPSWHGDLYLELHRGTYTTHSRNKRYNRKAEILYRQAELWGSVGYEAMTAEEREAQKRMLHEGWKLILLNQFHDIIPGTAITEAYETSTREYKQVMELGEQGHNLGLTAIAGRINPGVAPVDGAAPYAVFNSLGWSRSNYVTLTGGAELAGAVAYDATGAELSSHLSGPSEEWDNTCHTLSVRTPEIPAFGYTTIWVKSAAAGNTAQKTTGSQATTLGDSWETAHYKVRFNERGEIASLFDKAAARELIQSGKAGNRLHYYHDRPTLWDAWDVDDRFDLQPAGDAELLDKQVITSDSAMDILRFHWRLGASHLVQDVIFYANDRRIDFKTRVDWQESHKLLKVGFPLDIIADKATYEIPFGTLTRSTHNNTSWEKAQFEVCGHRFADLSEGGYGVSLLNDCKYGYDIKGSNIRLSLLRSPKWPDDQADLGVHEFTYSLFPHEGDWRQAHTVRKASELNQELTAVSLQGSAVQEAKLAQQAQSNLAALPAEQAFLTLDSRHVVLDTVKPAEDGDGLILRFYESAGGRETITLTNTELAPVRACLTDALETEQDDVKLAEGRLSLSFRPYEIKTVKLFF